jgi:hypothetical protein
VLRSERRVCICFMFCISAAPGSILLLRSSDECIISHRSSFFIERIAFSCYPNSCDTQSPAILRVFDFYQRSCGLSDLFFPLALLKCHCLPYSFFKPPQD